MLRSPVEPAVFWMLDVKWTDNCPRGQIPIPLTVWSNRAKTNFDQYVQATKCVAESDCFSFFIASSDVTHGHFKGAKPGAEHFSTNLRVQTKTIFVEIEASQ